MLWYHKCRIINFEVENHVMKANLGWKVITRYKLPLTVIICIKIPRNNEICSTYITHIRARTYTQSNIYVCIHYCACAHYLKKNICIYILLIHMHKIMFIIIDLLLCVLISLNTNISSQRMEFICNKFFDTYTNIYVSIK